MGAVHAVLRSRQSSSQLAGHNRFFRRPNTPNDPQFEPLDLRHRRKQHNKGGGGLQLSAPPRFAAALGQPWVLAELDSKQPWLTNTPLLWPDEP